MTPADREAARAALYQGRAIHARLDQLRSPEDVAADIIDLWTAAEAVMRAMLSGAGLSGQALIRELRQRGFLTLEQANALASFWDARTRVDNVGYQPTLTDVSYARVGYNELANAVEGAPMSEVPFGQQFQSSMPTTPPADARSVSSVAIPSTSGVPPQPAPIEERSRRRFATRFSPPVLIGGAVFLLLILAGVAYTLFGRSSYDRDMATAIDLMRGGQTEAARAQFSDIAREHSERPEPHVFLARLARNEGDLSVARHELELAIRADPGSALAQREMGLLLLSQGNAELARRFLVRAVQLAPLDSAAQGYLGCALMRLHRVEEGQRFLSRAGLGSWSSCATMPTSYPMGAPAGALSGVPVVH